MSSQYTMSWRRANPERYREQRDRYLERRKHRDPAGIMLSAARHRAKKFGYQFTLTHADVVIPEVCPVLGIPLVMSEIKMKTPNSPSIDRIDSSKGYTPDNIAVISWRANFLKSDGTEEEFAKLHAWLQQQ